MTEPEHRLTTADPGAADDRDPSNEDIELLTAPLEHDDNVFSLVNKEMPQPLADPGE